MAFRFLCLQIIFALLGLSGCSKKLFKEALISENDVKELFSGKRIALVGPAKSFVGQGYGEEIDNHDLVVRMNYPKAIQDSAADYGVRTDIIFTYLWDEIPDNFLNNIDIWKDVKLLICAHENCHARILKFKKKTDPKNIRIPISEVNPRLYRNTKKLLNTSPLVGIITLRYLLKTRASKIDIYGMDFYLTGYPEGRAKFIPKKESTNTAKHERIKKGLGVKTSIGPHNLSSQKTYFVKKILPKKKVNWVIPKSLKHCMFNNCNQ